eukprot:CAMPEP_0119219652 /NCGR_PEP_ID=MMETSP1327-20130426/23968_1 /TAXON_ID=38833 /ORGANISM="Micromonas pusilla, Strain RCC2306" /LENGTH=94 /DNA_ID=CAMNT_0007217729 /DNA_START=424 /DNA_END=708 /DNA_ORIENTATION=+
MASTLKVSDRRAGNENTFPVMISIDLLRFPFPVDPSPTTNGVTSTPIAVGAPKTNAGSSNPHVPQNGSRVTLPSVIWARFAITAASAGVGGAAS